MSSNSDVDATETQHDGVFIDINEDGAIVGLQLRALDENGQGFIAGGYDDLEAGRYELRKVEEEE